MIVTRYETGRKVVAAVTHIVRRLYIGSSLEEQFQHIHMPVTGSHDKRGISILTRQEGERVRG